MRRETVSEPQWSWETDEEPVVSAYPKSGSRKTLPVGESFFNLLAGYVELADGTKEHMSRGTGDYCVALLINTNYPVDIRVKRDGDDLFKTPVFSGWWKQPKLSPFDSLTVKTTKQTFFYLQVATVEGAIAKTSNPLAYNRRTLATNQKNVTSAGTAEALQSQDVPAGYAVVVRAKEGNSGNIYVGNSGVSSSNGDILNPGGVVELFVDDVSDIYIDADNDGEGVSWVVEV